MKFKKCENCNKFSHCNNNNLVCVSEYNKLYKTLTEIKEIVYELTNEEYTDFIEEKQKQILNKISEVIENE